MSEKTINLTVKISGFAALAIGAGLLVFTFMTAYGFLKGLIELSLPGDIMGAFGEALAPLIDTGIKAIFLGIMGWTGSILSRRGVQVLISPVARTETKVEKSEAS
ncbi:MAG: hypothetical protein NWF12_04915 [Candidatus Bathyarchaeota archaeon]|nr:hypothetical protein [Candidatus Bathyarchaeota archaeon]